MQSNATETLIRLVVVAILGGLMFLVYSTSGSASVTKGYDVKAAFTAVDGISPGTDVRMNGIKIGTVSAMDSGSADLPGRGPHDDRRRCEAARQFVRENHVGRSPRQFLPGHQSGRKRHHARRGRRHNEYARLHRYCEPDRTVGLREHGLEMRTKILLAGLLTVGAPAAMSSVALAQDSGSVDIAAPQRMLSVADAVPGKDGIKRAVVLRGLDKIFGKAVNIFAPVGVPVKYATLTITAHYCYSTPQSETPETTAFIQIEDHRPDESARRVYSGWMLASSPSLNPMDHPLYDVWVISCKTNQPGQVAPAVASHGAGQDDVAGCGRQGTDARAAGRRRTVKVRLAGDRRRPAARDSRLAGSTPRRNLPDATSGTAHRAGGNQPLTRCATRCTSATLLASRSRMNMLSPKNAAPRLTP